MDAGTGLDTRRIDRAGNNKLTQENQGYPRPGQKVNFLQLLADPVTHLYGKVEP